MILKEHMVGMKNKFLITIGLTIISFNLFGQINKRDTINVEKSLIAVGIIDSLDRRQGTWVYYRNGTLCKIENYLDNELNGITLLIYPCGNIKMEINYQRGNINGEFKFFSKNGLLLAQYKYVNNKVTGVIKYVVSDESPPLPYRINYLPSIDID
jgi:antitoxin component YwqK of YwqJK toxin-antitoxin module